MLKAAVFASALGLSSAVFAMDVSCPVHPTAEWMKESDARAQIEAQGYKIAKFKVDDNCYEVEAYNKDGRKVELNYDTKTLAVIRQKME
ncbi:MULTISPECIES: PepSY domain-containing protein [Paraburkholderia]|uniref:PepSY domain-containing protein n=1 Tax=Paraburkholderia madseniana TaxID=2599607 RepID=A0A6N6WNF5_9BURK|nr:MULTISPECIES: PepSY domain-containing protein [Paraburkholderia]KAE8760890.1 PepSY domain-containing protein [Paraburkholderia madseniana]MCX4147570.1 PepSY domain-containing protein [Paraburkholderia madseniana]MCX4171954.1 PepSY domain-containing protein [Paraburkholderia madseniana]MDN7150513.1 PepSY domain-containing protein [Paraburkholderia sp. WS6]MDQ6409393.1 PepSY domain-containing protein [Paraburkholderia madseniana]